MLMEALSGRGLCVGLTGLNMFAIRNTGLVACAGIGSPLSGLVERSFGGWMIYGYLKVKGEYVTLLDDWGVFLLYVYFFPTALGVESEK